MVKSQTTGVNDMDKKRTSIEERVKEAERKLSRLKKVRLKENKAKDTRRKIVVGEAYLKAIEKDKDLFMVSAKALEEILGEDAFKFCFSEYLKSGGIRVAPFAE
jgi:hypothetical protein